MEQHSRFLRVCYSRTHDNKWPQSTINSYINLATVHRNSRIKRDEADRFTRATLHDGIDEILAAKEPIAMEDVLKPLKGKAKVNCVLVEGPPGVGKSTFAWELCQRWDSIPDLKKFSLVVLLRFRDKRVQEAKDIADLFYHDDAGIQQAVAKEVCSRNGEGVLLILDGFDEFPAPLRKQSLLLDIMKGSRLPGCTVVVTSRPSATADLFDSCRVDKHIEVLGFTQKEIAEYASTAFASEPQLLGDFHKYRKLNPAIRSMMYIPLNTAIVADVFLSTGEPLSHTMSELFVEMSLVILKRRLIEIGCHELADQLPNKLQDLPSDIRAHFLKLGEMAFAGVVNEEVIFNELPTECEHFGFLNASPELYIRSQPRMSSNFLHRSFQELFTAFHISQLLPNEQKDVFYMYFNKDGDKDCRFKEVWKFLAGLTSFRDIGWEEVQSQCTLEQLVSYLYEAQDVSACDSVLGEENDFDAESLFDCHAVGWYIAASECRLKLYFNDMESGAEVCEAFVSGVKSRMTARGSVSSLSLLDTPIKEEGLVHLMELPPSILQQLSELDVSGCELDSSAMKKFGDLVVLMVNLEFLDIQRNEVGEGGFVKLFHSLSQLVCLEKLWIGYNSLGCADVEALQQVLIPPGSGHLKELMIWRARNMSPQCQQLLIETLFSPSSLESLKLHNVDVSSACDSFALLADNHNLTSITVEQAPPSMLEALKLNQSVETLTINSLQSNDVAPLVEMVRANKHLQTLEIQTAFDGDEQHRRRACLEVINSLEQNHTLKKLVLSGGYYQPVKKLFTQTEIEMDSRVVFI